eukprot:scaffold22717_cov71-Phaeocystis_antarctica.AAC.2
MHTGWSPGWQPAGHSGGSRIAQREGSCRLWDKTTNGISSCDMSLKKQPSSKKPASTLTPSAASPSTAAIASRAARSAAERGATTSAAHGLSCRARAPRSTLPLAVRGSWSIAVMEEGSNGAGSRPRRWEASAAAVSASEGEAACCSLVVAACSVTKAAREV